MRRLVIPPSAPLVPVAQVGWVVTADQVARAALALGAVAFW